MKIDRTTLQGKLFAYRVKNELTYSKLAKEIGLDKSTLIRFEKDKMVNKGSILKFKTYLKINS